MECQRRAHAALRSARGAGVRLTDQALIGVALARRRAERATVVDLLLGLAEEQEGAAGLLLRARPGALVDLAHRQVSPRLAPLDVAAAWAAADAEPRPASTLDLLAAAHEAGGAELRDLLDAVGLDVATEAGPGGETFGLPAPDARGTALTAEAELAVARTRAAAGGAAELLAHLDPDEAQAVGDCEDVGLDAVLGAARAWRGDGTVTADDLLRATAVLAARGR